MKRCRLTQLRVACEGWFGGVSWFENRCVHSGAVVLCDPSPPMLCWVCIFVQFSIRDESDEFAVVCALKAA